MTEREAIRVLDECKELQRRKGMDYHKLHSDVKEADYYPNGIQTIVDLINIKTLRLRSLVSAMKYDASYDPSFESLEDSLKDLINYSSFGVEYLRGKMEGQQKTTNNSSVKEQDIKKEFTND